MDVPPPSPADDLCVLRSIRTSEKYSTFAMSNDVSIDFDEFASTNHLYQIDKEEWIFYSQCEDWLQQFCDKFLHILFRGRRCIYRVPWATVQADEVALINRKLPKELLLRIFSFLDIVSLCRCASVCRTWNILAMDGSNWQRVDLFSFQRDVKGPVVENLAKRCGGFLKVLSLKGCENVQDNALKTFTEKCNNIEELYLEKCKRVADVTSENLGRHCKRLRKLDLHCCLDISDNSLKSLGMGCPMLEWLNVAWIENITDSGVTALCRGCQRLQFLNLKGCRHLTDDALREIAANCHDLRVLNLYKCQHITDAGVQTLADGCQYLQYLCLSHCPHITDRALQAIAQGCPMLKDLELSGCSQLTDAGFNHLAKHCHDLERMDLEECTQITDETLRHLAGGCHNLILLSLSHCEQITDEGIKHLAMSLAVHDRLKEIELDNCPLITDASLHYLKDCRTLERVELYDCQLITRAGIRNFRNHLPNVLVHAYFAPHTPPPAQGNPNRRRFCRCCAIL